MWNSNSPNLNLLRRYSLRTTASPTTTASANNNSAINNINSLTNNNGNIGISISGLSSILNNSTKSTCTWEPSADNKYLIGYIVISRQDLENYHTDLGLQLSGGKSTHDGHFGAIIEHVAPGSLMNIVCKLKVGDEIVEWNGFSLRNRRNEEVCGIIEQFKNTLGPLRLVAVRLLAEGAK